MNWNESKLLIVYPSRSRPERFKEGLLSITNNLWSKGLCTIIVSLDSDDARLEEYKTAIAEASNGVSVILFVGESKSKIHACNRDINKYTEDWDIVILFSDDMRFIQDGFDLSIRNDFAAYFPDGDGCLHYPDQHQGEACMTMNITDRKYFERFGYIYHPDYVSVECDLENQEVAKMLGRYRFVGRYGMLKHLHPSFGDCDYDPQYNKTEALPVHEADKATRRRRKANNYDLIKTETGWDTIPPLKAWINMDSKDQTVQPQTTEQSLAKLMENTEKTMKLRDKLNKKVTECKSLQEEINALGIVKVEVNVSEEALK